MIIDMIIQIKEWDQPLDFGILRDLLWALDSCMGINETFLREIIEMDGEENLLFVRLVYICKTSIEDWKYQLLFPALRCFSHIFASR